MRQIDCNSGVWQKVVSQSPNVVTARRAVRTAA